MRLSGTWRRPLCLVLLLWAGSPCLGTDGPFSDSPVTVAEPGVIVAAPEAAVAEPDCVWPNCTAICEDCHLVPFSTCVIPKMFGTPCGDNAYCKSKLCFCNKGFCHHNSECVPRDCTQGARPEPFEPTLWARAFASLGPDMPHTAQAQEWTDFVYSTLVLPIVLVTVGLVIAMGTCAYIISVEDHSACEFLPASPWLLLVTAVAMFVVVSFGIVLRHIAMMRMFEVGHEQLDHLDDDLAVVKQHALVLNATSAQFSTAFHMIPTSCNMMPVRYGMEKLTAMGEKYVKMITTSARDISSMVTEMELKIARAKYFSGLAEQTMLISPLLPLVFMFGVIVAIITVTLISWCHHDPVMADKADDVVFRYGGCCIGGLIVTTAILAGLYLWTGISEGALCVDVDVNIMLIINDMNFTEMANFSRNIDGMIDQTFQHYILGNDSNPVVAKINLVDTLLEGMYNLWNKTEQYVEVAEQMCPAFDDLDMQGVFRKVEKALRSIRVLVNARNVYPYYEALMHTLLCGTLIESTGFLVTINVVIGLIAFPFLAVVAHADLDRWSQWKSNNRGKGNGRTAAQHAEQSDPLLAMQPASRQPSMQLTSSQPGLATCAGTKSPPTTLQQRAVPSQQPPTQPAAASTSRSMSSRQPSSSPAMPPWQQQQHHQQQQHQQLLLQQLQQQHHHPAALQVAALQQQQQLSPAAVGPWQPPTSPMRSLQDQGGLPPGALWSSAVVGHSPVASPSLTTSGSPTTSTSARTSEPASVRLSQRTSGSPQAWAANANEAFPQPKAAWLATMMPGD